MTFPTVYICALWGVSDSAPLPFDFLPEGGSKAGVSLL